MNGLFGRSIKTDKITVQKNKFENWMRANYDDTIEEYWKKNDEVKVKKKKEKDELIPMEKSYIVAFGHFGINIRTRVCKFFFKTDGLKQNNCFEYQDTVTIKSEKQ